MERECLTKAQRWKIADWLAEDRLDAINAELTEAVVKDTIYTRYVKRAIDILVALAALVITCPINIIIGVITFFDVGAPLFFKQIRTGKNGKEFCIVKFRNMRELRDGRNELLPVEQRVTRFGRFVRRTSLDELLNFWSILKGDMSLIGPRPLVPEYTRRYNKRHIQRLAVRPGLECPPRKRDGHVWTWQEQLDNDVWYVEHVSFLTDCRMLLNLFLFMLDRKSAAARATARRGIFMGYDLEGKAINLDQVPQEYVDRAEEEFLEKEDCVAV